MLTTMKEAVDTLLNQPTTLAALIIVLGLLVFVLITRKVKLTPLLMAQIGISVAICAVLNALPLFKMPQGGSVTLASTLPIVIMAFAHGPEVGMLTGFIFGMVNLFLGPTIIHPLQTLLDYPLPFMLVGASGYMKNRFVGAFFGQFLRVIMHVLSGVIFFSAYAPVGKQTGLGLWLYSIGYNGSFVAVEFIILTAILAVIPWERFMSVINQKKIPSRKRIQKKA